MAGDLDLQAGDGITLRVHGLRDTLRALNKAGADAEDMRHLMHALGTLVVRAARPPVLSGRLASTVRSANQKNRAVVRAGGARAPYAPPIHYGWLARNIAPQPFLAEALNRNRPEILRAFEDGLDDLLRKADLK